MKRGRKRIGGPVLAGAGADSAAAASAIARAAPAPAAGTRDNGGNPAGNRSRLNRPGGEPGREQHWGGFYGWSIKHNVQEAAEGIGSPGQAARKSGQEGTAQAAQDSAWTRRRNLRPRRRRSVRSRDQPGSCRRASRTLRHHSNGA